MTTRVRDNSGLTSETPSLDGSYVLQPITKAQKDVNLVLTKCLLASSYLPTRRP